MTGYPIALVIAIEFTGLGTASGAALISSIAAIILATVALIAALRKNGKKNGDAK